MPGLWGNIIDAFSQGGIRGQQHQRFEEGLQKQQQEIAQQDALDRQREHDLDFHDTLMKQGYKPSVNGMVREEYADLPGMSSPAPTGGNLPTDVPLGGESVPPVQGRTLLRPLDKTRAFSFKDHTGADVTYEQPTPMEQARFLVQRGGPARDAAVKQAGDVAQATGHGSESGRQAGLQEARQGPAGITLPAGSGVGEGQKFLPEELPGVTAGIAAATGLPSQIEQAQMKLRQSRLTAASQSLGSVTQPGAYKLLYDRLPDEIKASFDSPAQFDQIKSPTRARMVGMKPEEQQTTSYMLNMKPEDWQNEVQGAVQVNAPGLSAKERARRSELAASTMFMVNRAMSRGDFKSATAAIKDAADQVGRTRTAVASAEATVGPKIFLAGAEAAARNAANMGDASGANGEPSALAKSIANYGLNPTTALARMPPGARNKIMQDVMAINPEFKQENYNNFNKTEIDATTGKIGTSANALNTMMGHLEVLNQAADALKNNNLQQMNRLANFIGAQTGSTAKTTYDTILHRLGPEVTKAYLASGGSVGERGTNEEDFSSNLGPDQIKANIGVSAQLADSKIKALQDQYKRGTYGRGNQKLISDEAESARQRLGGQSTVAALPDGGGKPIDKATATQFYKAAGGDPKKARALAEKNHWRVQ